jgi:hypothetical protein
MAKWDIYLAASSDMSIICPLYDCSNLTLDVTLNRPGRLSFNYPLDNEFSLNFQTWGRCIVLVYNGTIYWSGPILSYQKSLPDESINVIAVGWQELLYHRELRAKTTYTTQTRGAIIHALLAVANAQKATWITAGTNADDAPTISKTFELASNIGQGIEEMTSIEAGPDITVNPTTRTLDIKAWDDYVDRTEIVWGYGWGPENLENFSENTDGAGIINRLNVYGKNSATTGYLTQDIISQANYNLFETSVTLSTVSDSVILAAYGEGEIVYKSNPRITYQFQPIAGDDQPLVFRDFQLGDKCYLKAKFKGLISVDQPIRVFSCSLQVDENGNPKMTNVVTVAS